MKTKTKTGFSFIELVVVAAIIIIMTAVVLLVVQGDRSTKELQAAERAVAGALREVQNSALTGKQYVDGRFPCNFTLLGSGANYSIIYDYHTGTSCTTPGTTSGGLANATAATFTLENDVTFGDPNPSLLFTVPFGRIQNMPPAGYIDIPLVKREKTFHVCVYASGRIEERDATACNEN